MNASFAILGVLAISMVGVSFIAYRMRQRYIQLRPEELTSCITDLPTNSSLEEDFKDILACIPRDKIVEIFYDYLMYDNQIANTRSFIHDQGIFVLEEIQKMPQTSMIIRYLRDLGLDIDNWQNEICKFWKKLPRYERSEPNIAAGGLTVMIQKIIQLLPKDELHTMLWAKARYSKFFKAFIMLLCSSIFIDMCQQIEKNTVLRRHLYWAVEADIEAIFAIQLIHTLHLYLTEGLV